MHLRGAQLGAIESLPETAIVTVTIAQASDAESAALKEALGRQGALPLLDPTARTLNTRKHWRDEWTRRPSGILDLGWTI